MAVDGDYLDSFTECEVNMDNDLVIHWMFEGFRQGNPRWIIQIYQKDHLVKHSSALHSQPLHNLLSPSLNPLILRRRSEG